MTPNKNLFFLNNYFSNYISEQLSIKAVNFDICKTRCIADKISANLCNST